jgi:hypothetical protein
MIPAAAGLMRRIDRFFDVLERPRGTFRVGLVVAVVTAALLYLLTFRSITPIWLFNQNEGGIWLDEAAQVVGGQVMYRDFFEFLAPGVVYLNAVVLVLFGSSAAVAGMIPVVIGTALTWLLWRISMRCLSAPWQLVPPVLFACLVYPLYSPGNHKWLTWTLTLAGIDLLMSKTLSTGRVAVAGMLVGASTLCTQDMGAGAFIGTLAGIWPRTGGRARIAFLLGGMTIPVLAMGYFAAHAGVGTIWQDLYVFPATRYGNANGGFALVPYFSWRRLPVAMLQWTIVAGSIVGGLALGLPGVRSRLVLMESGNRWLTVVSPGLVVAIVSSWSRAIEPGQMAVRCALLTVALAGLLEGASHRWPAVVRSFATMLVFAATGAVFWAIVLRQTATATLVQTRAGPVWSMGSLADIEWLQSQTTPGERVFLFPDKGGFYFLTRTLSATSYPFLQDMDFSSPQQVADAAAQLERARPRVGIFDRTRLFSEGPIESSSLSPLYRFVETHYESDGGKYFVRRVTRRQIPRGGAEGAPHAATRRRSDRRTMTIAVNHDASSAIEAGQYSRRASGR